MADTTFSSSKPPPPKVCTEGQFLSAGFCLLLAVLSFIASLVTRLDFACAIILFIAFPCLVIAAYVCIRAYRNAVLLIHGLTLFFFYSSMVVNNVAGTIVSLAIATAISYVTLRIRLSLASWVVFVPIAALFLSIVWHCLTKPR